MDRRDITASSSLVARIRVSAIFVLYLLLGEAAVRNRAERVKHGADNFRFTTTTMIHHRDAVAVVIS